MAATVNAPTHTAAMRAPCAAAVHSVSRIVGSLYPGTDAVTWFDLIEAAGWNDRPTDTAFVNEPL